MWLISHSVIFQRLYTQIKCKLIFQSQLITQWLVPFIRAVNNLYVSDSKFTKMIVQVIMNH